MAVEQSPGRSRKDNNKNNEVSNHVSDEEITILERLGEGEKINFPFTTISNKLEHFAAETPNKRAIQHNQSYLTYQDLNQRANQLAHYLLSQGISFESRVATLLEPGVEILVVITAIHKIGATYVPLDPEFPAARIALLMNQVQPNLILSQLSLQDLLNATKKELGKDVDNTFDGKLEIENILLLLDFETEKFSTLATDNPGIDVDARLTATIFFTSGTTGIPKGVMASYENVSHFLSVANTKYAYQSGDIIPAVARFTFSISIFELLSPLFTGATSVILDRSFVLDLNSMAKLLGEITAIHMGPSLLGALVSHIKQVGNMTFPNLRHISSGGDMVPVELLRDLQQIFYHSEIYVIYGCSEISCMGVTHFIPKECLLEKTFVGLPFSNVNLSVRDDEFKLVARGCVGNIFFSGNGLTNGYLDQDNLTQQKFFQIDGQRCYDTGDRGRLNEEGLLEFLGRKDFQIQLNGIRIELGEIESVLKALDVVKDGAISQKTFENGEKKLIAYVVKASDITQTEIVALLAKQLPLYMLPDWIYFLKALPLNHNFKLDRNALPLPKWSEITQIETNSIEFELVEAKTETQNQLVNIWRERLKIKALGINQNFYALGGDSLSLSLCIADCHRLFSHSVNVGAFFKSPEIIHWAKLIKETKNQHDLGFLPSLKSIKREFADLNCAYASSWQQNQFWFLFQQSIKSSAYNIPFAFKVVGSFNPSYFSQVMESIVEDFESLRTVFYDDGKGLKQSIQKNSYLDLKVQSVSFDIDDKSSLTTFLNDMGRIAFDLTNEAPFRVEVIKFSKTEHIIFIAFHHIIVDQTAIDFFGKEVDRRYMLLNQSSRLSHGNRLKLDIGLDEPQISPVEYAIWQKKLLSNKVMEDQQAFWLKELQSVSGILDFPLDHQRSESNQGEEILYQLDSRLLEQLELYGKQNSVSVYTLLLAIYASLLYRYTAQVNIVIGTPFINRDKDPELYSLMGCLINTLPIVAKFDVTNKPSATCFSVLVEQLNSSVNKIRDHQDISFQSILEVVNPQRGINYNPIYQVALSYQESPLVLKLDDLEINPLPIKVSESQLDISLKFWRDDNNLQVSAVYNSSIINASSIENFLDNFNRLANKLVEQPLMPIDQIDFVSATQKSQLRKWNETAKVVSKKELLLDKFDTQVKINPNRIAIVFEGQQLTYKELYDDSESLANYLIENGVEPGSFIGIHAFRSIEMVIATYAIIRIGCAYVPIDPEYPQERKLFIIEDASIDFLISHLAVKPIRSENSDLIVQTQLAIDNCWEKIRKAKQRQEIKVFPSFPCYLIYTSGSTGKPKGVATSHESLLNSLNWMQSEFDLKRSDCTLLKTSFVFDVSVWELFWIHQLGGKLAICKQDGHLDFYYLKTLIKEQDISFLNFVPAMLQAFLAVENLKNCPSLRYVLSGGEVLSTSLCRLFYQKCHAILYNGYGPTETAICVSLWRCPEDYQNEEIPLGGPVDNTSFYIFNREMVQVPLGVVGELYIAGIQVAKGYLKRAELSQDSFINGVIDGKPVLLYKTGDLVKFNENGEVMYVGREDFQVKLRGLRIELGEIETQLESFSEIRQAICLVTQDNEFSSSLVGFYLREQSSISQDIDISELKTYLSKSMPSYMIPPSLFELDEFPINISGKLDRNKLLVLAKQLKEELKSLKSRESCNENDQLTDMEKIIINCWKQITEIENIDKYDSFFDIGGTSLLSVQVIYNIQQETGVILNARNIGTENLAQLANRCEQELKILHQNSENRPFTTFQKLIQYFTRLVSKK